MTKFTIFGNYYTDCLLWHLSTWQKYKWGVLYISR